MIYMYVKLANIKRENKSNETRCFQYTFSFLQFPENQWVALFSFFFFFVCPLNYIYFLLELVCFVSSLNMHIKHTTRGRYYAYFKKAFLYGALWEV